MKNVAAIIQREKLYPLECTSTNVRRGPSICFWEGKELMTMTNAPCGRDAPAVRSCVLLCLGLGTLGLGTLGLGTLGLGILGLGILRWNLY